MRGDLRAGRPAAATRARSGATRRSATRSSAWASEGAAPFYTGDIAQAAVDWIAAHDGILSAEDLRRYEAIEREPLCVRYRGRDVFTNPPPSAGGILLALALGRLNRTPGGPPSLQAIVAAMEEAQDERTPEFLEGLAEEGFAELVSRLAGLADGLDDAHLGDRRGRAARAR